MEWELHHHDQEQLSTETSSSEQHRDKKHKGETETQTQTQTQLLSSSSSGFSSIPDATVEVSLSVSPDGEVILVVTPQRHLTKAQRRAQRREVKYAESKAHRKEKRQQHKQRVKQRKQHTLRQQSQQQLHLQSQPTQTNTATTAEAAASATSSPWSGHPPWLKGKAKRAVIASALASSPTLSVVVDFSVEDLMNDMEVFSAVKQVRYLYADNIKAQHPLNIILTSVGPATQDTESSPPLSATNSSTLSSALPSYCTSPAARVYAGLHKHVGFDQWLLTIHANHFLQCYPNTPLCYLTAESPHVLQRLSPNTVYIIGGLVDHNKYKCWCENTAQQLQVPTARLPINECMDVADGRRTVITINQVFQCLLEYWQRMRDDQEREDAAADAAVVQAVWAEVFSRVLPKRSGWTPKQKQQQHSTGEEDSRVTDHATASMVDIAE